VLRVWVREEELQGLLMIKSFKAVALGLSLLLANVSVCYGQDFAKGLEAAQKGDYATALRELRPLAAQGDARAQYNLGVMYDNGQGVTQDYKEAVRLYGLAAAQGFATAQYNLGLMYAKGDGVIQDNIYAHMWLNIAASSGLASAVKNRDIVAKTMTAADISKAQGLARECVKKNYKGC